MHRRYIVLWLIIGGGCFAGKSSKGGGQISDKDALEASATNANAFDIEVPSGYRIELVAQKLTFPTGVTFGDRGQIYVVESGYAYGEKLTTPRIVEIGAGGTVRELFVGKDAPNGAPWTGITFHKDGLFVAHGGALDGGKIVRHELRDAQLGAPEVLVDKLPSTGDHHTNGPVVTSDGWVYFGQGTATNSGVVGTDNHDSGWLKRRPTVHDVPCKDVALAGLNWTSKNPLTPGDDEVTTGAYLPFGTQSTAGQVIKGVVPCSGAVMRVRATGGELELVAWGFRNPFGLALAADESLYVTDNGYDTRGSRPVFGAADMLWRVEHGRWYGWPDFSEGRPLTAKWYSEDKGAPKGFLITNHPNQPPEPAIYFPVHSSATGLDFSKSTTFGHVGMGFVALFGDMAPGVGKVLQPVGFAVMKVDPKNGDIEYFARNKPDRSGPASKRDHAGLERPIAARFDRDGKALYIVDFGIMRMTDQGAKPVEETGKLWRITREVSHAVR